MGKRADNKVAYSFHYDKDLKEKFKQITESNKTCMADVIVQAIETYVKEHEQALEAK